MRSLFKYLLSKGLICRDRGSASSPADRASIPRWRGGTTAGITSHPISAEQVRREESTERDGRQMLPSFSSLRVSRLPATQHGSHPHRGCPPGARGGREKPGDGERGSFLPQFSAIYRCCAFLRARTCFRAAGARCQPRGSGASTSPRGSGSSPPSSCTRVCVCVQVGIPRILGETFGSS